MIAKLEAIVLTLCFIVVTPALSLAWQGTVVKIVAGDTMEVMKDQRKVKVRLYGTQAPESDQSFSKEAREFLSELVLNKDVEVEEVESAKRRQPAKAIVTMEGRSVNRKLVEAGLAWVTISQCNRPECRQWQLFEAEAKSRKKGVWSEENPIPPWEWKGKKSDGPSRQKKG